ncbi:MAG: hypothetical protein ABFE16_07030 [Armatimonadia bacterium]
MSRRCSGSRARYASRCSGAFTTVIVPWPKGQRPEGLTVSMQNGAVVVSTTAGSLRIGLDGKCDLQQ